MEHAPKPTFTTEEIHALRVELGNKYRTMPKEAVEADISLHANNALQAIRQLREANNKKD